MDIIGTVITHNRPEYTLQLHDQVMVHALQTMLADEVGKLSEVTFLLQNLVSELGLSHHTIKVRGNHALEGAASTKWSGDLALDSAAEVRTVHLRHRRRSN